MNRELYMEFFQISVNTFYLWKKQKRPVIEFFSKYSTDDEIKEFIKTGKIDRIEKLNALFDESILKYLLIYIDSFTKNSRYTSLSMAQDIFIDFYFQFLCELKNNVNLQKDDFNALLYSELHKYVFKKYIHNSSVENVKKRLLQEELIDNKISRKEILHITAIESQNDFFRLQSHFSYFRNWDEGMLFFLDFNLKNNFKSFLNRYGKELLLHTIGLNVYLETSELDLHYTEKLYMVASIKKELLKKCEENEISLEEIIEHIEKYKNEFLR
jgi:hypothetical protein